MRAAAAAGMRGGEGVARRSGGGGAVGDVEQGAHLRGGEVFRVTGVGADAALEGAAADVGEHGVGDAVIGGSSARDTRISLAVEH